jgi:uncharacterized membrane protein
MKRTVVKKILTILLALFFVSVGTLHFVKTALFVSAMPPYIPSHTEMVYISGVFEILGGIGVLVPRTRKWAGYGLIVLLIAVYPAYIHMATHSEKFTSIPPAVLWVRLIFQPVFMTWVWYCVIKK